MSSGASTLSNAVVIVRGIGERTESTVAELVRSVAGAQRVHLVTGAPFSETLRKSFEAGLEHGYPWTFCIDADVILIPSVLGYFQRAAQLAPRRLFGIQGFVLDKFFGGIRPAGVRLYRTALLREALTHLRHVGASKRPETSVRRAMQRAGYVWLTHGIVSGLHDFEQYYRDVYRTTFFHSQKHRAYVPLLRSYWERMSTHDPDFLVALRGAADGLGHAAVLGLDARNFSTRAAAALAEAGLTEKGPWERNPAATIQFAEDIMAQWEVPPEYDEFWQTVTRPSRPARFLGSSLLGLLGLSGTPEQ